MYQENVFKYISDFLDDRRKRLYPGRDVHFELDSQYCDYDPMVKRRMTCCTYKVHQRILELSCTLRAETFTLQCMRDDSGTLAGSGDSTLAAFLQQSDSMKRMGETTHALDLSGKNIPVTFIVNRSAPFFEISGTTAASFDFPRRNDVWEIERVIMGWIEPVIRRWIGAIPYETTLKRNVSPGAIESILSVSRQCSTIDIDTSDEIIPQVFRWQENSFFHDAAAGDLTKEQCLEIIGAEGIPLPPDHVILACCEYEIDDPVSCTLLRLAHHLPDPSFIDGNTNNLHRYPGSIVVENDFHHFYIDGFKNRVIGEYWKWR